MQSLQLIKPQLHLNSVDPVLNSQFVFAIIVAITAAWLGDRYTKFAEERQKQVRRREASTAVADILSEWVRSSYMGDTNENRWRLQSIYWKNILLLDKELLDMLTNRLANANNAPDVSEIIVLARQILLELPMPDKKAEELNYWAPLSK